MGVAGKECGNFLRGFKFLNKKINENLKYLMTKEVYKFISKTAFVFIAKNLN